MSKEIVLDNYAFIVSETDLKGNIIFANNDFCDIAGYSVDELIGQPHNIIRHPDMPKAAFKEVWNTLKSNEIWEGLVKNSAKNGDYYWVYATIYPTITSVGEKGYISCRKKPAESEILKYKEIYQKLKMEEK